MTSILKYVSDFLGSIWNAIQSIFEFVIQTVKGLVSVFLMLPKFISYVTSAIGFLPSLLAVFATATVAIAIIYFVIGRNTNN